MDSIDDEIILPNSPLHAYLTDAGFSFSDLDVESLDRKDKPQGTPKNSQTSPHITIIALFVNLKHYIWHALSTSRNVLLSQLQTIDTQALLKAIIHSPCLEDEDRRFLSDFLEGQPALAKTKEYKVKYVAYLVLTALSAFAISRWLERSPLSGIEAAVVLALCFAALVVVIKRCLVWHQEQSLRSLLDTMRDFQSKVKKCLQLIQETEVVARGFTLASHNVPVQRLEMNKFLPSLDPQRQCPELRRSVFVWTRELFLFWRGVTCQYTVPLEGELDASSIYLAFTQPENISHELFTSNDEDLKAGTENFSLSSLKAMLYFLHVQHSEFLRRIALCMMPGVTKSLLSNAVAVARIVNQANFECQQQLRKLNNAHQFYVSSCVPEDETEVRVSRPVRSDLQELQLTVHSLVLHLRAALKRVQAVETITESLGEETKLGAIESQISCLLAEVKAELGSSSSCLEEAALLLDREAGRTPPKENPVVVPSAEPQSAVSVLTITEQDSPVIVDEVFEALLAEKPDVSEAEPDDDFNQDNKVRVEPKLL
ncbi:vezatin [Ixodes scapularis]